MVDVNQLIQTAISSGQTTWYILLLAFFSGVAISFTPCVYPMIPITAGILQSQASQSLLHNFLSSLSYIIGIALVYATLGYLSATTSVIFGTWLSNPVFIGIVIVFFLYFAFSMFGFYELYIPQLLTRGSIVSPKGTLLNSLLFGLISGTVASPCLTPALALLLGIVAKQANPILGFATLFCFALGMGILLLLIGTFSATITLLPRAGEWMLLIKTVFGFLIFAACLYFLQTFFSPLTIMIGYSCIAAVACIYYIRMAFTNILAFVLTAISFLATLSLASTAIKMLM